MFDESIICIILSYGQKNHEFKIKNIFIFYDRDEFPGSVRLSRCFLSVLSRELVHGEPNALAPAAEGCLGHSYLGCVGLHPLQKEDFYCIIDTTLFYVFA